jgi:ribosomal protein S12 methylthiotransferase
MRRQREISAARRRRWVGRTIEVLVENISQDGGRGVGRSQGQAPEIDGVVRLRSSARAFAAPLVPGQFVSAHVTGSTAYDLEAILRSA